MKPILITFLTLIGFLGYSQITLDFQSQLFYLVPVKLSDNETKYFDSEYNALIAKNQLPLYNLDYTPYKTIVLPPKPDSSATFTIEYISRTLFDNDPENIEYMVTYVYDSVSSSFQYLRTKIIREDGTILFDELNAAYPNIYSTENGTKLMLFYRYASGNYWNKSVFSLPGMIPSVEEQSNLSGSQLRLYPNPNKGSFSIQLRSNEGKENVIDLYNSGGKLIDTYKSSANLLQINNFELPNGLYFLNNRFDNKRSVTKMVIKR
jgi:hypothetical protein